MRAASGPGDSGDRDRGVGPEAVQRAVGHRLCDGFGHRPMRCEQLRFDAEQLGLRLVRIGDDTAGAMPARYVIHAATMELGGPTSAEIIARATRSTLSKADALGCRSLALVAFGTGVGGFPLDQAAQLMVDAVGHEPRSLERVVFAVHGDEAERAFRAAVES